MAPTFDFSSIANFGNPATQQNPLAIPDFGFGSSAPSAMPTLSGAVSLPNTSIDGVSTPGAYQVPGRGYVPTVAQPKLGWNLGTAQTGLNFAQTGANIWSAWKAASLAQQQLDYAKKIGDANLANQIKSYNTNLEGKANMNAVVGGWSPDKTQQYIDNNKLTGK